MSYAWYDLVGNVGVALIVGSYLLLQLGRLAPTGLRYSLLNAAGAGLVLVSLWWDFNLSAFVIEAFWVGISGVGIVRASGRTRQAASAETPTAGGP